MSVVDSPALGGAGDDACDAMAKVGMMTGMAMQKMEE